MHDGRDCAVFEKCKLCLEVGDAMEKLFCDDMMKAGDLVLEKEIGKVGGTDWLSE
jgi:hypothetical protein